MADTKKAVMTTPRTQGFPLKNPGYQAGSGVSLLMPQMAAPTGFPTVVVQGQQAPEPSAAPRLPGVNGLTAAALGALPGVFRSVARTIGTAPADAPAVAAQSGAVTPVADPRTVDLTPTVNPQAGQLAFLDALFRRPLTLHQAQVATGLIPAPMKPPTPVDQAKAQNATIADGLFQNAVTQLQQQLASGAITKEQQSEAMQKATDDYFRKRVAAVGGNPYNISLADMVNNPQE